MRRALHFPAEEGRSTATELFSLTLVLAFAVQRVPEASPRKWLLQQEKEGMIISKAF